MLPLALAALGLLGTGVGMIGSAQQNKKFDQYLSGRSKDLQSSFDRDYNRNYLDTDIGQSTSRLLQNQFGESLKNLSKSAVAGQNTVEARVGAADKLGENYSDALLRLAGYGTQYKDNLRQEFNRRDDALQNLYGQNIQAKVQNFSNLANNSMNAMTTALMLGDYGDGLGGLWGKRGLGQGIV